MVSWTCFAWFYCIRFEELEILCQFEKWYLGGLRLCHKKTDWAIANSSDFPGDRDLEEP
ncbi:hypothetical protein J0895_13295 [Phormidium pseudopriestleyi FRX01]|uniref:Uncharacterized protein n=1 Tax=Phormidium pseudopriestleyi FRX01 TaxID=1759528 RepID=A0ABS3FSH2_9CYAN|nr:hypothetical protein [Phormidium pseudopriestleyi]MBO0350070.1 hypothetical protein [Phormidium pseudopriestleyi FRX01]